jgi:hypothetical protein
MSSSAQLGTLEYLRSFRIAKMAIFDWVATIIGAAVVSYWKGWNFIVVLIILLVISIPLHIVFGVRTYTNYYLGLDKEPAPS